MKRQILVLCIALITISAGAQSSYRISNDASIEYVVSSEGAYIVSGTFNNNASVTIPETINGNTVINIQPNVFANSTIGSLKLPKTITTILDGSFSGCIFLKNIVATGVKKIGDYAFFDCRSLERCEFTNLEQIGLSAFQNCKSLREFEYSNPVKKIDQYAFAGCTELKQHISYSNASGEIGKYAFLESGITSLSITSYHVGKYAFAYCENLKSVELNSDMLDEHCFEGCKALTKVTSTDKRFQPNIKNFAFANCSELANVSIEIIKSVGEYAFAWTPKLNCALFIAGDVHAHGFEGSGIKSVELHSSLIDDYAFANCKNLTNVTSTATTYGKHSFEGSAITKLTITNNASTIGDYAFANCNALEEVQLKDATVGSCAFLNCTALKSLELNNRKDGRIVSANAFKGCNGLKRTDIYGTNYISNYEPGAFEGCTGAVYIHDNTHNYILGKSPLTGSSFTELFFIDKSEIVGQNFINDMPRLTHAVFTSIKNLINPIAAQCPALTSFYDFGNDEFSNPNGLLYDKNMTTLYAAPIGKDMIKLLPTTTTIDCSGISRLSSSAVIDARELTKVPELTTQTLCFLTFLVKPGMKQKFIEYGKSHYADADFSVYENATYIEAANNPLADVNADGSVNATDVVEVYNYILNGE